MLILEGGAWEVGCAVRLRALQRQLLMERENVRRRSQDDVYVYIYMYMYIFVVSHVRFDCARKEYNGRFYCEIYSRARDCHAFCARLLL